MFLVLCAALQATNKAVFGGINCLFPPSLLCENLRRDAVSFYDECIEKNRNVVYKRTASGLHYGPLDKIIRKLFKLNCDPKISSKMESVRKCL